MVLLVRNDANLHDAANVMTTTLSGTIQETIHQRLERLRGQIRGVETACRAKDPATISSGVPAIDSLLPGGGYARGSLAEWLAPAAGCGAEWLALQLARRAAADGGAIVIIDPRRDFYPPAAVALGLRLEQLVIVQGRRGDDLYWAIDQALRCTAVAAVWAAGSLGAASSNADPFLGNIDERWLRRFQLSAEQSGALGIFVRHISVARQPTWCDIQWRVATPRLGSDSRIGNDSRIGDDSQGELRPISLQLLKCRGATSAGQTLDLELDTRSGELRRAHKETDRTAPVGQAFKLRKASS